MKTRRIGERIQRERRAGDDVGVSRQCDRSSAGLELAGTSDGLGVKAQGLGA